MDAYVAMYVWINEFVCVIDIDRIFAIRKNEQLFHWLFISTNGFLQFILLID